MTSTWKRSGAILKGKDEEEVNKKGKYMQEKMKQLQKQKEASDNVKSTQTIFRVPKFFYKIFYGTLSCPGTHTG